MMTFDRPGDDQRFQRHARQHPEDFVLNTANPPTPDYMVVHRLDCWTLTTDMDAMLGRWHEAHWRPYRLLYI